MPRIGYVQYDDALAETITALSMDYLSVLSERGRAIVSLACQMDCDPSGVTDGTRRNTVDKSGLSKVNGEAGITKETILVICGNGRVPNWYGIFACWV